MMYAMGVGGYKSRVKKCLCTWQTIQDAPQRVLLQCSRDCRQNSPFFPPLACSSKAHEMMITTASTRCK